MAKIIRGIISVLFGSWLDADGTLKPIEWEVLKQDGNKALLISKYVLQRRRFDITYANWSSSEIRGLLNGEFMDASFSYSEKEAILETTLSDVETTDKVFLLSCEEAKTLYKCDEERSLGEWWWLRSPGDRDDGAAYVIGDYGELLGSGIHVFEVFGVRPALWVNLDSDIFKS